MKGERQQWKVEGNQWPGGPVGGSGRAGPPHHLVSWAVSGEDGRMGTDLMVGWEEGLNYFLKENDNDGGVTELELMN